MADPFATMPSGAGTYTPAGMMPARAIELADNARRVGNTLQSANQLQADAEQLLGNTRGYQAIAGNRVSQGMIAGSRVVAGRVVPLTNLAGSLSDLARAQETAAKDFTELTRILADPHSTMGQRLIASAKATQSAAGFVQRQQSFVNSLDAADRAYLAHNGTYARLTQPARPAVQVLGKVNSSVLTPIVKTAAVVGSTAGVVLGAVALPSLVQGTADAARKLASVIDDPTATEDQKLSAIADTTRGGAGVIMAANGIKSGVQTLIGVAQESRLLGPAMLRMAEHPALGATGKIVGGLFKVLLPVADAGMLVADAVKLKQTLTDPGATGMDKARAVLAVGLGVIKVATYLLPQTMFLRVAYMIASFGQMGLAAVDLGNQLGPALGRAGAAIALAITNPAQAWQNAKAAIGSGIASLGSAIKGLGAKIGSFFAHPSESTALIGATWNGGRNALQQAWHVAKESAALVNKKLHQAIDDIRQKAESLQPAAGNPAPAAGSPAAVPPGVVPANTSAATLAPGPLRDGAAPAGPRPSAAFSPIGAALPPAAAS